MNTISLFIFSFIFMICGKTSAQDNSWIAPKSASELSNPLKDNSDAAKKGKKIFENMCVVCHGIQGKGNGIAGVTLTPKPANFLALNVVNETDGDIYWKLTQGKPPMASYKELLTDEQRWQLVNYIRFLERK